MLRQVVESAGLRSIGYDRVTRTLEIEFRNGSVYQYAQVPDSIWHELRRAESKGTFFQQCVRDRFATLRLS